MKDSYITVIEGLTIAGFAIAILIIALAFEYYDIRERRRHFPSSYPEI